MARPISDTKRTAIIADLRRGDMTHKQVAEKHEVSVRTVDKISTSRKNEPTLDPILSRLDKLAASAERALELAEASNDGKQLSAAIRAAHEALKTVERIRADVGQTGEASSREEVERIKKVILEEVPPNVRKRVAARLLEANP